MIASTIANDAARFELTNSSGQAIDRIQVSPVSSGDWGRDLLGSRILATGNTATVTPGPDGCMFDVRVTYRRGGTESFRSINLCRTSRISFANTRNFTMN